MNYQEFLIYKEKIIKDNPTIINLANNNLYDFFKDISFIKEKVELEKVHRCHLVEDYLRLFSQEDSLKKWVGASSGVRSSLSLLFPSLSNWSIPSDVYPFYIEEKNKSGNEYITYETLNESELFKDTDNVESLLVTYPMKPNGRELSVREWANLSTFLDKSKKNVIVIDMVYQVDLELNINIEKLYKTNQVVICHSLSKMYLLPNIFGITLLPQNDKGSELRKKFTNIEKNEEKLKIAHFALNDNKNFYELVNKKTDEHRLKLKTIIDIGFNHGYLFYVNKSPELFLKDNILVIPESVFGGKGSGSILSSLF